MLLCYKINFLIMTIFTATIYMVVFYFSAFLYSLSDNRARVSITHARTKQPVKLVLQTKDTAVYVEPDSRVRTAKMVR